MYSFEIKESRMKDLTNANQTVAQDPRAVQLKNELDRLKAELKRTRGRMKRFILNEEIRSVASALAKYMN